MRMLADLSQVQYAAWRAYLVATTPKPQLGKDPQAYHIATIENPDLAKKGYRPVIWGSELPKTFVTDEAGTMYFFDAVIRNEHTETQRITSHPVQTGANKSDHSFSLPAQLTLEIGMSDVMDSYSYQQWGTGDDGSSRSVKAYQTILGWKQKGMPLTINTRLGEYQNMVVVMMSTPDDITTKDGLRCHVTFQEILTFTVSVRKVPYRAAVTETNAKGQKYVKPEEDQGSYLGQVTEAITGEVQDLIDGIRQ